MRRQFTLGQFLKERRTELGFTQMSVARALGYSSPQFVSNWERGMCDPAMDALPELCKILGIPKNDLADRMVEDYEYRVRAKLQIRRSRH